MGRSFGVFDLALSLVVFFSRLFKDILVAWYFFQLNILVQLCEIQFHCFKVKYLFLLLHCVYVCVSNEHVFFLYIFGVLSLAGYGQFFHSY